MVPASVTFPAACQDRRETTRPFHWHSDQKGFVSCCLQMLDRSWISDEPSEMQLFCPISHDGVGMKLGLLSIARQAAKLGAVAPEY